MSFTIPLENEPKPLNYVCIQRPAPLRSLQIFVLLALKIESHCQFEYISANAQTRLFTAFALD